VGVLDHPSSIFAAVFQHHVLAAQREQVYGSGHALARARACGENSDAGVQRRVVEQFPAAFTVNMTMGSAVNRQPERSRWQAGRTSLFRHLEIHEPVRDWLARQTTTSMGRREASTSSCRPRAHDMFEKWRALSTGRR